MPSTISKRFSFKSLKRRFTSDSNDSVRSEKSPSPSRIARSETLPPDVEKGEHINSSPSLSTEPSNGSNTSKQDASYFASKGGSRSLVLQNEVVPPLPTPPATIGMPSPQLFASPEASPTPLDPVVNLAVSGVMDKIHAGPQRTKAEKFLNKMGESCIIHSCQ